jgi:pyruvate carboxylase subunit B
MEVDSLSRYEIVIDGVAKAVELQRRQRQQPSEEKSDVEEVESYYIKIEGSNDSHVATIVKREPNVLLVSLDNRVYALRQSKRTSSSVNFMMNGRTVSASLARKGSQQQGKSSGREIASVNELVSSNFPAKVVSIKVFKGDKIKEGETLLILEAMKMEAQIKAPRNCEVFDVLVHEGDIVPRGAKLIQLKFIS